MQAEIAFDRAAPGPGAGDPSWLERAEGEWLTALDLATDLGFPVQGVRAAFGYAGLLRHLDRGGEGDALLRDRIERCPEGLDTPRLAPVLAALDGA